MRAIEAFFKRYLPKSLFGRALLILLVPILVLQVVVASIFVQRHFDALTAQMATTVARELNYAITRIEDMESFEEARTAISQMSVQFGIEMGLVEGGVTESRALRRIYDFTGGVIEETFKSLLNRPMALDLVSSGKYVDARIVTSKGILRALVPRRRLNPSNPHQLLIWMVLTGVVLVIVSVLFLRSQIKPINELANAAAAFGRGRSPAFRPSGAEEVRSAGTAFIDMRMRIERAIEQRTRMLSGVSHDLRTPLTRIKLALAVAEETPETREIGRDIDEMSHMLDAFLNFARGEGGEPSEPADPAALAEEVAADARRLGIEIALFSQIETMGERTVEMRRGAIKRCLTNLVDNAASYGAHVAMSVRLTRRTLEFSVEDDGPGIPEDKREEVLRPFTRLDEARNQDVASGVGLGLTIAQDIARAHGGSLHLDDSPRLGGLRATLRLPR
ncbi:MAG TPA: ATP-binding protein [Thermohalobaculum sp.]|nr:ATP-binding protein [Thermohalobaculum sp.]